VTGRHPAWHPDGGGIAFEAETGGGSTLAFLDLARSEMRPLTEPGFRDQHPAWFPDGRRLAFHSDRAGGLHLFVVDVETGGVEQISRGVARYKHPAVSPGGNLVACVMSEGPEWTLALLEAPSGRRLVERTEGHLPQHPAFAGATTLVYQGEVGGGTALFRLDLREVGDVQLTDGAGVHKAAVSPDGRHVAFSARLGPAWEVCLAPLGPS
jgi:Tol biopolymer transport system component